MEEVSSPINQTIDQVDVKASTSSVSTAVDELNDNPKESFFDKWVRGFMNFLANED